MGPGGFLGATGRLTGRRLALALAACAALALLVSIVTPLLGVDATGDGRRLLVLDPRDALAPLFGAEHTADSRIFWLARLPRTLAALIVGAGLAAAGCAFQALLRNPLADPYTLGISSGSSLAAVLAIRFGLPATFLGGAAIGLAALAGAGVTVYLVWRLGRVGRSLPPATLLLGGITIAMFCSAATMLVQYTSDFYEVNHMVRWMMGGLEWIRYPPLLRAGVPIAAGLVVLLLLARDLNALSAGDDAAASVGVDPTRSLTVAFVTASLIVGAGISLAGPIGFVGLIVPHAVRAVVGPDHRVLLPASMLAGGALLIVCDTVARTVIAPNEIPVGVATALLGGPFFLYLLGREKNRSVLWGG
jgi:iron complex transport system permease protein